MASPRLQTFRFTQSGNCYAVTTVAHGRRAAFLQPGNAGIVVEELRRLAREGAVTHLAWVLMPDHLHWLFRLNATSLGNCVKVLKARSSRVIHQRDGDSGTFWQSGYYEHRIRDEEDLHAQARYLIENPLRKGLATRIEDYPFWWCRWMRSSADLS